MANLIRWASMRLADSRIDRRYIDQGNDPEPIAHIDSILEDEISAQDCSEETIELADSLDQPQNRVEMMTNALSTYLRDVNAARQNVTRLGADLHQVNMQIATAQRTIQDHARQLLDPSLSVAHAENPIAKPSPDEFSASDSEEEDHTEAIESANAKVKELQVEKKGIVWAMKTAKQYLKRLETAIQPFLGFVKHISADEQSRPAQQDNDEAENAALPVRLREDMVVEGPSSLRLPIPVSDSEDASEAETHGIDNASYRERPRIHSKHSVYCHSHEKYRTKERNSDNRQIEESETRDCDYSTKDFPPHLKRSGARNRKRKVAEMS
ncbi:unnamed protein product [Periconia digitata]|uniref:Uncharacterized protein n=1 Tax=Periconia digitata TaxID=1303443 RepID=A0A9W4XN61_9PLEO|nr:unnamed protein product [Periconia digitata]